MTHPAPDLASAIAKAAHDAFHELDEDMNEPDHHHVPAPGTKPNPGSPEAVGKGCTCPRMDNGHGRGSRYGAGVFIMAADCPLHNLHRGGIDFIEQLTLQRPEDLRRCGVRSITHMKVVRDILAKHGLALFGEGK